MESNNYESIICINCFKSIDTTIGDGEICPHCGANNHADQVRSALPFRTVLQGRFMTGKVNSANGEGFTYKAFDEQNQCVVEIREFCPVTMTYRDGKEIFPSSGKENEVKALYKEFLILANSLASVGVLNAVIPVITTFIENNTCYIVYKYYRSISLASYIDSKGGYLNYNSVQKLFEPLINSLSTMHNLGIRHLGINPKTLRICEDGKMRLSEFLSSNLSRTGSSLKPRLTQGTSAIEQYREEDLGEYTDVYAVSACMLYAVSGSLPISAPKRLDNPGLYISGEIIKTLPENFITAIANALQIEPEDRITKFSDFKDSLFPKVEEVKPEPENQILEITKNIVEKSTRPTNKISGNKITLVVTFIISGLILYFALSSYVENLDLSFDGIVSYFSEKIEGSGQEDTVLVPNLIGESYESWQAKIEVNSNYNFKLIELEHQLSDTVEKGLIIKQYPDGLEQIEAGGEISVIVSLGPTKRVLPTVAGKGEQEATELLEADGFAVTKQYQENDSAEVGTVLWYGDDRNVGDTLDYATQIILVICGKE